MTGFSPGARDRGISGLARLADRECWRTSPHRNAIATAITNALRDSNPLVRWSAVPGLVAVETDVANRIARIETLLASEPDHRVRNALLSELWKEGRNAPLELDETLRRIALAGTSDQMSEVEIDMVALLGLEHATPFATEQLHQWASDDHCVANTARVVYLIRPLLATDDVNVQARAFEFAGAACTTAVEVLLSSINPVSESEQDQLKALARLIDNVTNQIYFASGAYDSKKDSDEAADPSEPFATLAIPVLLTCARTNLAPVLQHVVETLIFLAPINEERALLALAQAVTVSGPYVYDSMAGDAVVPYLKRLVVAEPQLALKPGAGAKAFQHVLTAFVSAGSVPALELAFTFSDVFR